MPPTAYICPHCAAQTEQPGVCPRGHGWLLDLADEADRSELESHLAVLRPSGRDWRHISEFLALELVCFVAVLSVSLAGDYDTYTALWTEGHIWSLLAGGGAVVALFWATRWGLGRRSLKARTFARLLARTEAEG